MPAARSASAGVRGRIDTTSRPRKAPAGRQGTLVRYMGTFRPCSMWRDRKSTRLNSSHITISYAVRRALHSFPTRRSSDLGARVTAMNGRAVSARKARANAGGALGIGGRQGPHRHDEPAAKSARGAAGNVGAIHGDISALLDVARSEERRVGKECGAGGRRV